MSRYALNVVDLAIQKLLVRWKNGRRAVVDPREGIVYYRRVGRNNRLGSLEKEVLLILAQDCLSEAEIARRLGVWPQAVHETLKRLKRKDLVLCWTALGENLAGTRILRRFYALNPEKVAIAIPVGTPTRIQLQAAKEKAQREALERERHSIALMRQLSPKPSTRLKAALDQSHSPSRSRRDP